MQTFLHSTAESKTSAAMAKQAKYRRFILGECSGSHKREPKSRESKLQLQFPLSITRSSESLRKKVRWPAWSGSLVCQWMWPPYVGSIRKRVRRHEEERDPLPPDTPIAQWIMLAKRLSLFILPLNQPRRQPSWSFYLAIHLLLHWHGPLWVRARKYPPPPRGGLLGSTKASRSKPDAAQRYSALAEQLAMVSRARQMHLCLYLTFGECAPMGSLSFLDASYKQCSAGKTNCSSYKDIWYEDLGEGNN